MTDPKPAGGSAGVERGRPENAVPPDPPRGGDEVDQLRQILVSPTSRQVGALGEETAAIHLETRLDAILVALDDSEMPPQQGKHDLDIVAVVADELVAFEVKTRYFGRSAGRLTPAGDLPPPRLRRSTSDQEFGAPAKPRQGSQEYAAQRLASIIDIDDDFAGVQFRAIVVDLRIFMLQQFAISDAGRVTGPIGAPSDCSLAAVEALQRILDHRGYL